MHVSFGFQVCFVVIELFTIDYSNCLELMVVDMLLVVEIC